MTANSMSNLSGFNNRRGGFVALTVAVVFTIAISALVFGLVGPVLRQATLARQFVVSKISYFAAEAGSEDAYYRLKNNLSVVFPYVLSVGSAVASVDASDVSSAEKIVIAEGNQDQLIRRVYKALTVIDGFSFNFGVQTGLGGLRMKNASQVKGNVYSNGPIVGLGPGGNLIGGDAVSAGAAGSITGINSTSSLYAASITNSRVCGDAYYQSIDAFSANFLANPSASYCSTPLTPGAAYPGSNNQPAQNFPIPDSLLDRWESDAAQGGLISGSVACPGGTYTVDSGNSTTPITLGPIKIDCHLVVSGNKTILSLTGAIWVKGDLTVQQGATVATDAAVGNKSVAIIADDPSDRLNRGLITLQNNTSFFGNGGPQSYVMLVSRNTSAESGGSAVAINVINNAVGNLLVFAPHGKILMQNSANLKEVTAYQLTLQNNTIVTYAIGLSQPLFTTGPGGTWKVKWWKETR